MSGRLQFWTGIAAFGLAGFFLGESYLYHTLILFFIWTIVVVGWDLLLGYVGIFSFAQLVFFAAGAYATGMLSISLGVPSVAALVLGGATVGLIGILIGLPCLRLRGEYVALFTFAVHLALPSILIQGRALGTGGSTGLMGIPPMDVFGKTLYTVDKLPWYFLTLAIAALAVYAVYFVIVPGRLGKAFIMLRDSEEFAKSLGVNDYKYKLIAFTISAFMTGIAGGLYGQYLGVVTPKILGNELFLMAMLMLSVGGLGRFPGVILGAFIITVGNEVLRDAGQLRLLALGVCVVLSILLMPNGIIHLSGRGLKHRFNWFQGWR